MNRFRRGFTLIELLIVVALIAALAVGVFVALNPAQRLRDGRDSRRTSDVDTILSAVHASIVDNKGQLPTGLTAGMVNKQLGQAVTGCAIAWNACGVAGATDCVDLTAPLAKYLKSIPVDPNSTASASLTQYSIIVDSNGIVTVRACSSEGSGNISASR